MIDQPRLSEAEWALLVELLQHELQELPVEIHHTRTNEYREELVTRRRVIHGLLDRLQLAAAKV